MRDEVIREGGIARATNQNIRYTSLSISSHCYGHRQRPRISTPKVLNSGLHRHCIAWSPEAIALADQIPNRHPFNAPTDGKSEAASVGHRPSYPDPSKVLIRDRHDRFGWTGSSGLDSVRIARVEQVRPGSIDGGFLNPLVCLHVQGNAPATITQLNRLIHNRRDSRAVGERRCIL